MFREEGGRPNDARGFIHKKLLGFGSKVLSVGSRILPGPLGTAAAIASGITEKLAGGRRPARNTVSRTATARPSLAGDQGKEFGRAIKFEGQTLTIAPPTGGDLRRSIGRPPCDFPMVRDPAGRCRTPTSGRLGGPQFDVGEAVMGRYGAALEPGSMIVDRAVCLRGMQLGDDGLCYNKSQITNKQRMWPRGRKPLLTGGDMRAIAIASRAGKRLDATSKRLRDMGMMKRLPAGRGKKAHAHAAPVAAVSVG